MQTLIDATGPFTLPTGWHEVTTRQFCATDPLTTVELRANYFAGRAIQVNALVADALAWMLSAPPTDGRCLKVDDLGQESYLQVETIRTLLAGKPLHECYGEVLGTLIGRRRLLHVGEFSQELAARWAIECLDWPIADHYGAVMHCLTELERLATKYAELAAPDPTEAAKRAREAGAEELLGGFGHFNVAKAIAQQMGLTLDAAYALPYETVCLHLLHERRTAILSDTIQRNAKSSHE